MNENTAAYDSQWADWFRSLGGAAIEGYLKKENLAPTPAPVTAPAAGVPRWVVYAGVALSALGLLLLLRRK
jgi:MYXO-CTERM domain-containing protein